MPETTKTPLQLAIMERIREIANGRLGINRLQLAEKLGCAPDVFTPIASGARPLDWGLAMQLWRVMHVSPAWLAGDSDEKNFPIGDLEVVAKAYPIERPFDEV